MPRQSHPRSHVTQRQRRVGELLRRTLADLFANGALKMPDVSDISVTVSEVKISPDLGKATVYVLPLGGKQTDEVVRALNQERREVRKALSRHVNLKRSPVIHFVADPMFDQIDHMQRLLNQEDVKRDLANLLDAKEK